MSSASGEMSLTSQEPQPEVWLDLLPIDICISIARHARGGRLNSHATWSKSLLHLAESSAKQRIAVEAILPKSLHLTSATSEAAESENERWATLFYNTVRDLNFFSQKPEDHKFPLRLLQAPKLQYITIPSHPIVLRALANSKPFRTLRVEVVNGDLDELWRTLSTLEISRLEFRCNSHVPQPECPLLSSGYFSATRNVLVEVCPAVKSLTVECYHCMLCADNSGLPDALWHMYRSLPCLEETLLWIGPPDDLLPQLRKMQSVHLSFDLFFDGMGYICALEIGLPVKQLKHKGNLDTEMLSKLLSSCPRLENLELFIFGGAERALLEADHVLPNMRSLCLCWEDGECRHGREAQDCLIDDDCQPVAISGVLHGIVAGCVRLRQLRLFAVAILLSEVEAIMESIGSRLVGFGMSAGGQYEKQCDYLEAVVSFATTHNPSLRVLDVHTNFEADNETDNVVDEQQGRRILNALERLRRVAPGLRTPSFKQSIEEKL